MSISDKKWKYNNTKKFKKS